MEVGRPCCLQLEAAGPGKLRDGNFNRRKERDGDGDGDRDGDGDGDGHGDGDRDKDRGRWMTDRQIKRTRKHSCVCECVSVCLCGYKEVAAVINWPLRSCALCTDFMESLQQHYEISTLVSI